MRRMVKRLISPVLKPLIFWYLRKPRWYKRKGLKIKVFPGVFHPGLFLSTEILLDFIETLPIEGKELLELGAGSGAVGFYAEKRGAVVSLSDLSIAALDGLQINKDRLKSRAEIIESDLFESIEGIYDFIIINPPYYNKTPKNESEMAWFCGENFDYFKGLFPQLKTRIHRETEVYMILSQDCNIAEIQSISKSHGFEMLQVKSTRKKMEVNYIFSLKEVSVS